MQNPNSDSQNQPTFYKKVPGKWILAGEHAVLRGGDAIVFPLTSQYLEVFYYKSSTVLTVQLQGSNSEPIQNIVWSVLNQSLAKLNLKLDDLTGSIILKSNILFGAGMGASATLCVAITEFFHYLGYIKQDDMYDFARDLENIFHGESSGVDIAVVLRKKPLLFSRINPAIELENVHLPKLFLSHTGGQGITKECVGKVKALWLVDSEKAAAIDQKMKSCVAEFSNLMKTAPDLKQWAAVLKKANSCFYDWSLVNQHVKDHEKFLIDAGAIAVKLTGSGSGGFMLSLWDKDPTDDVRSKLIPCSEILV